MDLTDREERWEFGVGMLFLVALVLVAATIGAAVAFAVWWFLL